MNDAVSVNSSVISEPISPRREIWLSFKSNFGAIVGLIVISILVLLALGADVFAPYDPIEQFRDNILTPPVFAEGGTWQFVLGTDDIGRDMLSRLIHGSRLSLFIGSISVTISLVLGVGLGLIAGFFRGTPEIMVMRFMDIILAMPSLLLAITIVTILGPGLLNAMIAVAVTNIPYYARLTRASVINELSKDYVTASRVSGAQTLRLMFNAVLPNCMAPLIVQATLGFSSAIIDAAALGFLGLGAQPPTPEWGTMLASSRDYITRAPWIVTFPGVAILVSVLAFNLMGDGLRDALDPKLKR